MIWPASVASAAISWFAWGLQTGLVLAEFVAQVAICTLEVASPLVLSNTDLAGGTKPGEARVGRTSALDSEPVSRITSQAIAISCPGGLVFTCHAIAIASLVASVSLAA
jgi:hypothetical protein